MARKWQRRVFGMGRKKETEGKRKGMTKHGMRSEESGETAGEEVEDEHN